MFTCSEWKGLETKTNDDGEFKVELPVLDGLQPLLFKTTVRKDDYGSVSSMTQIGGILRYKGELKHTIDPLMLMIDDENKEKLIPTAFPVTVKNAKTLEPID